jgi:flagellar biosynthesis protein FlhF
MMKFIASTVDAAKAKAQRALGDKAVIISVRTLPSGDIEVSASDKAPPAAPPQPVEPAFGHPTQRAMEDAMIRPPSGARLNEPLEQRYAEDALARLRGDLSRGGKPASAPKLDLSDSIVKAMTDLLGPHGVGDELIAALVDGARGARINDDLSRLEAAFAAAFTYGPLNLSAGAPIMLVGPTGAGKTSCAAKLASAAIARAGQALIMTADGGRAGAIDQLRTYSDNLGADYYIVETPPDIEQGMRVVRPQGPVILDTPGVSPYDSGDLAALKSFQETCGAEAILVLPASGDPAEFRDWALAFRDFGVRRAIITKFDATKRVGAALNAAHAAKMMLAQFSETAFISEGLLDATPEFLARRLLASRPGRVG